MEPPLTFLTVGQVTDEANELRLSCLSDLAHGKLHREGAAVLSLADDDAAHANDPPLAGRQIAIQVPVVFVPVRRGHQHADIASLHLASHEAEEALRSRTKGLNYPFLVDDHHRVWDCLKNRPHMGVADGEFLVGNAKLIGRALVLEQERTDCGAQHGQHGHRGYDQRGHDGVTVGPLLAFAEESRLGLPKFSQLLLDQGCHTASRSQ